LTRGYRSKCTAAETRTAAAARIRKLMSQLRFRGDSGDPDLMCLYDRAQSTVQ
jgi:hypothetical protein